MSAHIKISLAAKRLTLCVNFSADDILIFFFFFLFFPGAEFNRDNLHEMWNPVFWRVGGGGGGEGGGRAGPGNVIILSSAEFTQRVVKVNINIRWNLT